MKNLIILILLLPLMGLGDFATAQVSTLPHSIGIGQNTLSSIPFHINRNGEVARFQGTNPFVTFYNGANWIGYVQAFGSTFSIGTYNFSPIGFYVDGVEQAKITGLGDLSVRNLIRANGGILLDNALGLGTGGGGMDFGADGSVLVATGTTSNPPKWEERRAGFQIKLPNGILIIDHNLSTAINNCQELYEFGDSFNPVTGEYTVQKTGLYQLEVRLPVAPFTISPINNGLFSFDIYINGTAARRIDKDFRSPVQSTTPHIILSETMYLSAGQVVSFRVKQKNEVATDVSITTNGSISDGLISMWKIF
jgi:hypothetical protein